MKRLTIIIACCILSMNVGSGDYDRTRAGTFRRHTAALGDLQDAGGRSSPGDFLVGGVFRQHGGREVKIVAYGYYAGCFGNGNSRYGDYVSLGRAREQHSGRKCKDGKGSDSFHIVYLMESHLF